MTPPTEFPDLRLTRTPGATQGVLLLRVEGFLDYDNADAFLAAATQHLDDALPLHELHLDCAGLDGLDSMGLSVLLMLHRRTTAACAVLHLDDPSPSLERLLEITGTLEYLTPQHPAATTEADGRSESPS
ncbi:STAS domain-containing protein [Streptomyces sp. NPDC002701]|uniref:STAS domain-containing protein n=1 Tax=Streptomyces sp. NPDC002701 TaxID=3364661 RepID=UPI0036AECE18